MEETVAVDELLGLRRVKASSSYLVTPRHILVFPAIPQLGFSERAG